MLRAVLTILSLLLTSQVASAVHVGPFLQNMQNGQVTIVWEDVTSVAGEVVWGSAADDLSQSSPANVKDVHPRAPRTLHVQQATLTGLLPDTTYFYQIVGEPEIHEFQVPPSGSDDRGFQFIVYSDTQWDAWIHRRLIERDLPAVLDSDPRFAMVAGDLVHDGSDYAEYSEKFFGPAASLMARIPYYPAIGNHEYQGLEEGEDPIYLNYFDLPDNGSAEFRGHWYSLQQGNAKVVSLNTSIGSTAQFRYHPIMYNERAYREQISWWRQELHDACANPTIDFVFATYHYPNLSEAWVPGNDEFAQEIVAEMDSTLSGCGKAGAVFNGHTHAYGRGQSRDAPVYWVTVGTAGGRLDYWGEYENADYEDIVATHVTYGLVVVTVTSGADPQFTIERWSIGGNPLSLEDPFLQDQAGYRVRNVAPERQGLLQSVRTGAGIELSGGEFTDRDGDTHLAAEWELFVDGESTQKVLRQSTNWYLGVDLSAGQDLTKLLIEALDGQMSWRVRYRDSNLLWTPWSPLQSASR